MANELENALKNIAAQVTDYVKDAAMLTVETKYVQVDAGGAINFDQAQAAARTIIKLDGDSEVIVPLRATPAGRPEIDSALFELHERNVAATIDYRTRLLNALLSALQPARR